MTVDASRSCLGLGTCVGSAIRQIVDARVLLTATVPPALPGRSVSYVRWRLLLWLRSCGFSAQPAGGTLRAMAQTNPANSRAIAVTTTCLGLPFAIMRR